jgi:hypothetical protein
MEAFHTETCEGFEINFYPLPEDTDPSDCFQFDADIEDVREGRCEWFCAKVTASRAGIVLGKDFLGACAYRYFSDFITEDGYYADMRAEVIRQARERLRMLSLAGI